MKKIFKNPLILLPLILPMVSYVLFNLIFPFYDSLILTPEKENLAPVCSSPDKVNQFFTSTIFPCILCISVIIIIINLVNYIIKKFGYIDILEVIKFKERLKASFYFFVLIIVEYLLVIFLNISIFSGRFC